MKKPFACLLFIALFSQLGCTKNTESVKADSIVKPNIIIFYIDDLGYGDLGSYGGVNVATPSIDKLANEGLRLTDAHSSSATCTPSRYSLLTGEHGFRGNASILRGDAAALIKPGKATLPSMLQKGGYTTGVVGKWHLGLGNGDLDWNKEISPGPLDIGFDYSFLLPATGDRVPTVYVENAKVVNLDPNDPISVSYKQAIGNRPSGHTNPELLRYSADKQHSDTIVNGVSRIGYMAGGESALWVDEEFPDVFTEKAVAFIRQNQNRPFFLFHSFHDIHVPRLPNPRFTGKSGMGPRGDAIIQMDWMTEQIVKELEKLNIAQNTIIIFTSDNGPVLADGYDDEAVELLGDHKPAGPFRGGKYSAFEAGTRVPMIVSWPGTIKPATNSSLISQMDIYASLANLLDIELAANEAPDSIENLAALMSSEQSNRKELIQEAVATKSLRHENWKYISPVADPSRGGFVKALKNIEGGFAQYPQLFDLTIDQSEQNNLADKHPELIKKFDARLQEIVANGY